MTATAVAMPKLGMTMEEGTVVEWPIGVGEAVALGAVVLIIESEKAEVEVEAPVAGVLRHVYVEPGETVPCGTLLAAITPDAADAGAVAVVPPAVGAVGARSHGRVPVTPAARVLARRLEVDLARLAGRGPGGRIVRADVQAWADRQARLVRVAEGVALDVVALGAGDLVVLLPGFGCDVSVFARQVPVLAERRRVLGVNPRGVAGSDAPPADVYSVGEAARDAAALLSTPAHVVGASLGSAVALEIALAAPEKVRSLTLLTPFVTADARLDAVCESWARLAAEVPPASLAGALLPWLFSSAFLADPEARGRTVRGLATTLARVPAATLGRALAGLRAWSGTRRADLARITAPTLVVVAGADLLTPDAAAVAAAIPHARCVEIAGAGHAVAIEAPDLVSEAITTHLAAAEAAALPRREDP
jgi:pyruvate dehydrogenase E2 component (dihydrolipoamide acetyltransferase)